MLLKDHILPLDSFQGEHKTVWDNWAGEDAENLDLARKCFPFADWKLLHRAHYRGYLGSWDGHIEIALCSDSTWWVGLFKADSSLEYSRGFSVIVSRQGKLKKAVRLFCEQYRCMGDLLLDHPAELVQMPETEPQA